MTGPHLFGHRLDYDDAASASRGEGPDAMSPANQVPAHEPEGWRTGHGKGPDEPSAAPLGPPITLVDEILEYVTCYISLLATTRLFPESRARSRLEQSRGGRGPILDSELFEHPL